MATKELWINLPVKDVAKAKIFFTAIGFVLDTKYGNTNANACFVIGDKKIVLMLFPETQFEKFTKISITDTNTSTEVLFSIDAENREEVDEMAKKATAAGGKVFAKPEEIQGWMYGCGFTDLDGHRWNVLHMDASKMQQPTNNNKECILIHTTVNATAEKVWENWTQPEHIKMWNNASDDWHTTKAENDLKIGGKFFSRMEAKDRSMGFDFEGYYTHIKNFEDIAYILTDSRKVNIHFEKTLEGIKITESFEPETTNSNDMQKQGWQAILDNFKRYTEKSES